jgi:hypothetical protein
MTQSHLGCPIMVGILGVICFGLARLLPIAWYWQCLVGFVAAPLALFLFIFITGRLFPQDSPPMEEPEEPPRQG